jgi:hypothetical protein
MPAFRFALAFLPLTLMLGCSDSSDTSSSFVACSPGELHIEGDIDGTVVNLTQSTQGSGFAQSNDGGSFWMSRLISDPTRMDLTIDWSPSIVDGATANVTSATVVMPTQPTTVAFVGQTFCAGAGSQIRIPKKSEDVAGLQFNLTSLSAGTGCTEAHTGTLRGCWR